MTQRTRKLEGALTSPDDNTFRVMDGILALKDWSGFPTNNTNRIAKLGFMRSQLAAIICEWDSFNRDTVLADGISTPGEDSVWQFEPDNFMFRKHEDGDFADRVWAVRMICDHSEAHNKQKNRSTAVIDQRDDQRQGHLTEVFWVKDVEGEDGDNEQRYSAAGEWIGLCTADVGAGRRDSEGKNYHTCINMYRSAGYVTDGVNIAQWNQIFKIFTFDEEPTLLDVRDNECPPGLAEIDAQDESADGETENDDGDKYGELTLWSDVNFFENDNTPIVIIVGAGGASTAVTTLGDNVGPLGIDQFPDGRPEGERIFGGMQWTNRKAGSTPNRQSLLTPNPDSGEEEGAMEDSPEFGLKHRQRWLRPYVCSPRNPIGVRQLQSNPPGSVATVPAGEDAPVGPTMGIVGDSFTLDFAAGVTTMAVQNISANPDYLEAGQHFRLYYTVDTLPTAGHTISIIFGYLPLTCEVGDSVSGTGPTFITKTILGSLPPPPVGAIVTPGLLGCLDFDISGLATPRIDAQDFLNAQVWRSKTDLYPGNFRLLSVVGIQGDTT